MTVRFHTLGPCIDQNNYILRMREPTRAAQFPPPSPPSETQGVKNLVTKRIRTKLVVLSGASEHRGCRTVDRLQIQPSLAPLENTFSSHPR